MVLGVHIRGVRRIQSDIWADRTTNTIAKGANLNPNNELRITFSQKQTYLHREYIIRRRATILKDRLSWHNTHNTRVRLRHGRQVEHFSSDRDKDIVRAKRKRVRRQLRRVEHMLRGANKQTKYRGDKDRAAADTPNDYVERKLLAQCLAHTLTQLHEQRGRHPP